MLMALWCLCFTSSIHVCGGALWLGQIVFHVLSSLALLDMESDGVNDGELWFLGLIWWEVSIQQNSMNGKSIHPCSWREELV